MFASALSFIAAVPIRPSRQPALRSRRPKSPSIPPRRVTRPIILSNHAPRPNPPSPSPPSSHKSPQPQSRTPFLRNLALTAFAASLLVFPLRALRPRPSNTAPAEPTIARATPTKLRMSSQHAALAVKRRPTSHASHGLEGTPFVVAATAALLASALAVSVTHPIDTLKTMRQASTVKTSSLSLRSLYRGVFSNILKEAPNAAIYLATYELFKVALMSFAPLAAVPLFTMCLAGMLGDALGSIVRVPAEIINKRLQLQLSSNWHEAVRDAFLTDVGVQSTITSWFAVLCRDVPFGGLQIAAYECVRLIFAQHGYTTLLFSVVAGAIAGLFASIVTTPADVLVTRLSTQPPQCYLETKRYMGCFATFRRILRDEGFSALWSGAMHRGLFYMPMIGLFFAAYESFKYLIINPQVVASSITSGWVLCMGVVASGFGGLGGLLNMPVLFALLFGCSRIFGRYGRRSRSTSST